MVERYTSQALSKSNRRLPSTVFKKGMKRPEGAGRKPGQQNKTTKLLKDALSGAAEELGALEPIYRIRKTRSRDGRLKETKTDEIIGWKPTGQGGTQGFLIWLGCNYPQRFATLLGRLLPYQIEAKLDTTQTVSTRFTENDLRGKTLEEKMALMREMVGMTKPLPAPGMSSQVVDGEFTEVGGDG